MREWTFRQYLTAMTWIGKQWGRTEKSDYYMMQLTAEVRRSYVRNPGRVRDEDFRIRFRTPTQRPTAQTSARNGRVGSGPGAGIDTPQDSLSVEQRTALAKAAWVARMTKTPESSTAQPDTGRDGAT